MFVVTSLWFVVSSLFFELELALALELVIRLLTMLTFHHLRGKFVPKSSCFYRFELS